MSSDMTTFFFFSFRIVCVCIRRASEENLAEESLSINSWLVKVGCINSERIHRKWTGRISLDISIP